MSGPPRFFISHDHVIDRHITISGEDVRHIATVLRMKTGDELLLCDGQGTEYAVKIIRLDRAEIETEIMSQSKREIRYPLITLGQGLPKSDKMDFIVQKATELGVAAIVPLITERTIMKIKDEEKRSVRWRKIAREAAMQSNRRDIPHIEQIRSFRDFIFSLPPETPAPAPGLPVPGPRTLRLLPWEEGTDPIRNVLKRYPHAQDIIVLIGPEGGFSQAEAETAKEKGFHLVSLGPNILRTETAAIASLSMIGYELFAP
jgi:16S rRNA (uracil1498-N3)-methyltransferase